MKCPLCVDEVLDVTFRSGIEVDVCPRCRGVWLDRGELDRLADASSLGELRPPAPAGHAPAEAIDDRPGAGAVAAVSSPPSRPQESKAKRPDKPRKKKKRKKKDLGDKVEDLFEELFDFFD